MSPLTATGWNSGFDKAQQLADDRVQNQRAVHVNRRNSATHTGFTTVVTCYTRLPIQFEAGDVIECECAGAIIGDAAADFQVQFQAISATGDASDSGGGGPNISVLETVLMSNVQAAPAVYRAHFTVTIRDVAASSTPMIAAAMQLYDGATITTLISSSYTLNPIAAVSLNAPMRLRLVSIWSAAGGTHVPEEQIITISRATDSLVSV